MLWLGFIPGTVATVATLFYAAKQIEVVGNQFAKFEKMGFTDRLQKYIVSACWAAYWVFMFFGMTSYAAAVPDDLGWGPPCWSRPSDCCASRSSSSRSSRR